MNLKEINTLITFNSSASTSQFPEVQRIILLNSVGDEIHTDILKSIDGWDFDDKNSTLDFPILKTDLKANVQDYTLPQNATGADDDIVKIKRCEVKLSNRFYKAEPFDVGERGRALSNSDNDNDFVESSPRYDMDSNSIFVYPTPTKDVTEGLKIWIRRSLSQFVVADLSSTTKQMGFDRQFHELPALKVALKWVVAKTPKNRSKINELKEGITIMTEKMKTWYGSKQEDREIVIRGAYIDYDTDRGNNNTNRRGPA